MDNFVGDPDFVFGKLFSRLVSDLHSALNSPAESIRLGQFHRHVSPGVLVAVLLQSLDDITCSKFRRRSAKTNKNRKIFSTGKPEKLRERKITGVLLAHELESLLLAAEPLAIVVLASRQVLPEKLGVEIGVYGDGGGGVAGGASDGKRLPEPEREGLREEEVGAGGDGDAAELESDRHGNGEEEQRTIAEGGGRTLK